MAGAGAALLLAAVFEALALAALWSGGTAAGLYALTVGGPALWVTGVWVWCNSPAAARAGPTDDRPVVRIPTGWCRSPAAALRRDAALHAGGLVLTSLGCALPLVMWILGWHPSVLLVGAMFVCLGIVSIAASSARSFVEIDERRIRIPCLWWSRSIPWGDVADLTLWSRHKHMPIDDDGGRLVTLHCNAWPFGRASICSFHRFAPEFRAHTQHVLRWALHNSVPVRTLYPGFWRSQRDGDLASWQAWAGAVRLARARVVDREGRQW